MVGRLGRGEWRLADEAGPNSWLGGVRGKKKRWVVLAVGGGASGGRDR
jgi:hypothetical protein